MTTTEFIKFIKARQADRKRLYTSHWNYTDPVCIVSESELEKIEKVNVELIKALQNILEEFPPKPILALSHVIINITEKAIKNASNIKQI